VRNVAVVVVRCHRRVDMWIGMETDVLTSTRRHAALPRKSASNGLTRKV